MKLREADLKLKQVKCNFLKKHIQYLVHIVSGKGITPMPEKLECIKEMPLPNVKVQNGWSHANSFDNSDSPSIVE